MSKLTLLEALFVTHFVMDWLFQTQWEAINKSKKWFPLLVHCSIYSIGFIPVFLWYKINFLWLIFIFISHIILDSRRFSKWWIKNIKKVKQDTMSESFYQILLIGVDQTLHIVILALIVIFS